MASRSSAVAATASASAFGNKKSIHLSKAAQMPPSATPDMLAALASSLIKKAVSSSGKVNPAMECFVTVIAMNANQFDDDASKTTKNISNFFVPDTESTSLVRSHEDDPDCSTAETGNFLPFPLSQKASMVPKDTRNIKHWFGTGAISTEESGITANIRTSSSVVNLDVNEHRSTVGGICTKPSGEMKRKLNTLFTPKVLSHSSRKDSNNNTTVGSSNKQKSWSCGACTFDNHEDIARCEMCDSPRQ